MNILIYIPNIDQTWGGVRQYAVGLIRVLAHDYSNKYFIYHNCNDLEVAKILNEYTNFTLIKDKDVSQSLIEKKIIRSKEIANFFLKKLSFIFNFNINSIIDRLIVKYKIDVIHCPYQYIPITDKAKLILTLHDVQELHFPEFFTAEERAHRATAFLDFLKRADKVVVSYKHVQQDLIKYFNVSEKKISVILLDMSKLWFEKFSGHKFVHSNDLNVYEKYIFYPANTWEHKNHIRLLKAISSLQKEGIIVNLVCSGHKTKYYDNILKSAITELYLEKQVMYLGVVSETDLYTLYKQCVGVVIPTLYEAGSFPLMESILLGVPVICSNVTSLPETIGNEKFIFNPYDIDEIALRIKELWQSSDFRNESAKNSKMMQKRLIDTGALNTLKNLYTNI